MSNVQLTVLIATRNGEHVLPRVLDGYRKAIAPPVPWKIIVVDNGSTDSTSQVLSSYEPHLPLQALSTPNAGKSRALNLGLQHIEGRLVVLADDDAIPSPSFLGAWAAFLQKQHDFEVFGGQIEPLFDDPVPQWLLDSRLRFAMMFGEHNLPEGPTSADEVYGANWAVRTSVFERGHRFNEGLGPDASDLYPMGEETEFCRRSASSGSRCWFAREPHVRHIVKPELLTGAGWAKRAYRLGRGRAWQMWENGKIKPSKPGTLRQRLYNHGAEGLRYLRTWSPRPLRRFNSIVEYHVALGFRDECRRREHMLKRIQGDKNAT
jgi:glycosyltransferase involved in cell wall biosynthesis